MGEQHEQFRDDQVSPSGGNPHNQGASSPGDLHKRGPCENLRCLHQGNSESCCFRATDSPQPARKGEVLNPGSGRLPLGQSEEWMNVSTVPGNFATLSRLSGCLHRIEVSHIARHLGVCSLKQTGIPPVELAGDAPSKKARAPQIGCGGGAVRYENDANGSCKKAPGFSLYLQLLRIWSEFALSFAELLIAAHFICTFDMLLQEKNNEEMHI